jgi:Xaa-Pro aminopeptidase
MKTLGMDETISIQQVRVAAGKKLDLEDNQDVSVLKGDWVWIQVNCQRNGLVVSLARLSLVGEPSSEEQMDFLSHLHDAVDWMVETIRPNKKMAFYFTESRGRSILPRAFSLDPNSIGELLIGPGKSFQMMTGSVFSVEPVVQSADFGDVFINQMVYLDEEQLVVI